METSISTDSSDYSNIPPPPPLDDEESSSSDNNSPPKKFEPHTPSGSPTSINYQLKTSSDGSPKKFEPSTPSDSPPKKFEPSTPSDSPPRKFEPSTPSDSPPKKFEPRSPSGSPPKNVGPQTPSNSPPEIDPRKYTIMVENINEKTGHINRRPRFYKPEHDVIQYYYQNLSDEQRKILAGLSEDMQAKILMKIVNELKEKYPETTTGYMVEHLNYIKNLDMLNEVKDYIKDPSLYDDIIKDTHKSKLVDTTITKLKTALDKKQRKHKNVDLYSDVLDTAKILLSFKETNKNLKNIIEMKLKNKLEKRCNSNGYIKMNTLTVINYSSGILRGNNIEFTVIIQYKACYPVEGMIVRSKVKNVTKAGIRAEISEKDEPTPMVIFIARDHHNNNDEFINVKEGDYINAKIIGKRFELNDSYISVIAEMASNEINV